MKLIILGTAAGGGWPQWNCACESCEHARATGKRRTQDCLAVSGDDANWYLINASPDLRSQVLAAPELRPAERRRTPIRGVLLSTAELDHTLGLLQLREATELAVHSTSPVRRALTEELALGRALASYTPLHWEIMPSNGEFVLTGGLRVTARPVGTRPPRYVEDQSGQGWVTAFRFDGASSHGLVYAPCLPALTQPILDLLEPGDLFLVDGTFYVADEMTGRTGVRRDAHSMGHLPVQESLPVLCEAGVRILYTHLNNTNPLCDGRSAQRRQLEAAGASVAEDGQRITW